MPSNFKQLQYIQSSGSQYIDTGVSFEVGKDFRVNGNFINPSTSYRKVIAGNYAGGNESIFNIELGGGSNRPGYFRTYTNASGGTASDQWSSFGLPVNEKVGYDVSYYTANRLIDNVLQYGNTTSLYSVPATPIATDSKTQSLWLFLDRRSSPSAIAYPVSIGTTKIYKDNVLVGQFVPAKRVSDGAIGMYDTVSGTFKTNAGSGAFTAGPEF